MALDLTDNIINVSDITDRVDELREELQDAHEEGQFMSDFKEWVINTTDNSRPVYAFFGDDRGKEVVEQCEELRELECILEDLEGYGGNHQWEGNWYPDILIRDDYFTQYAEELVKDIGDMPKNIPSYIAIDWEATANNLKADYSTVDVDGTEYFYRD